MGCSMRRPDGMDDGTIRSGEVELATIQHKCDAQQSCTLHYRPTHNQQWMRSRGPVALIASWGGAARWGAGEWAFSAGGGEIAWFFVRPEHFFGLFDQSSHAPGIRCQFSPP